MGLVLSKPDWLLAHLSDPRVRVFDCTMTLVPQVVGKSIVYSGVDRWQNEHIPGALHLNMISDLSAPVGDISYGLPETEFVQTVMRRHGINSNDIVVVNGQLN